MSYYIRVVFLTCVIVVSGIVISKNIPTTLNPTISEIPSRGQLAAVSGTGSGLIAHYTLDEGLGTSVNDASGNGNSGTLINGPAWSTGRVGSGAISLDGSNDYVSAGDLAVIDGASELTVATWVKLNTFTRDGILVSKGELSASTNAGVFTLWRDDIGSVASRNNTFSVILRNNTNTTSARIEGASSIANDTNWHHVAFTFNQNQLRLFVDGVEDPNSPVSTQGFGTLKSNSDALEIGRAGVNTQTTFLGGAVDDVRIYTRALAVSEIGELASGIYTPVPPGDSPINGQCSSTVNTCTAGSFVDTTDSSSDYLWNCNGVSGGSNASCTLPKPPISSNNGIYTVKKDGTGNYSTIQACLTAALPGETCVVGPGTYTENLTFGRIGTSGNLIKLRAEHPFSRSSLINRTVVEGSLALRAYTGVYGIEFVNKGISIEGSGTEIVGNYIHGTGDTSAGVAINMTKANPYHSNVMIKDNYIYQITYGILVYCGGNCLVENNDIERLYTPIACRPTGACNGDNDHVRLFGDGIIFRGNYIHGSSLAEIDADAHVDGIQTFNNGGLGGQGRDTLSNTVIENNMIQDSHQTIWWTSIRSEFNGQPLSSHHVTIRNNIFRNTWGTPARMSIGGDNSDELYIYNNIFAQSVRITAKNRMVVKNNVFFSSYANTADDRFAWPQKNYEMTHNIIYTDTAWLNRVTVTSFPQLVSSLSHIIDPDKNATFVNTSQGDFHLVAGSRAINAGTNLASTNFTNDKDGNARNNGGAWDIGPYEYTGFSTPPPPPPPPPSAQTCATVTQYGITWTFDKAYPCGQFVNSDWWVVGPVTITSITPSFDGNMHGFEVNPNDPIWQGFDSKVMTFRATKVPTLPYTAEANQSVVKAISLPECISHSCIKTAAVLTVLGSAPTEMGAKTFRPPYAGSEKPLYTTSQIRGNLLTTYAPVASTPTLTAVAARFQRVWLDHKSSWSGRAMHPADNMPDYGSDIGIVTNEAALRLMLNDSVEVKMPALVNYLQYGIDLHGMLGIGTDFRSNGGHGMGRLLPLIFTGHILGADDILNRVRTVGTQNFHENESVTLSNSGMPLWGQPGAEIGYWRNQVDDSGSRTEKDPYGYIDGGRTPGSSYQYCCNSKTFKGMAIAQHIMPALKALWNYQPFLDYVDRWVIAGAYTQPDPCAPQDGNWSNYGITYGPDGHGSCIKDTNLTDGVGRYPALHGTNKDGGLYGSSFANAMWAAYRGLSLPPPPTPINGVCGQTLNICSSGTFNNITDSNTNYLWQCLGVNAGTSAECSLLIPTFTLSVSKTGTGQGTVTGTGISCGSDCSETVVTGTNVILTAVASSGSTFVGWSSPCSGTSLCTVSMTEARTITTTFNTNASVPIPVNAICGITENSCTAGTLNDTTDSTTQFLWSCTGQNGGSSISCNLPKPSQVQNGGGASGGGAGGSGQVSSTNITPTSIPPSSVGSGGNVIPIIPPPISAPTVTLGNTSMFQALREGSTHASVRQLQELLNTRGYTVSSSGAGSPGQETTYFGPATLAALKRYHCAILSRCSGSSYGVFDEETAKSLNISTVVPPVQATTPLSYTFIRTLRLGIKGEDVKALQVFLNSRGFTVSSTDAGSPGQETTFYGVATSRAVTRFQEYYRSEILVPNDLTQGNGYFGPSTLKKANSLMGI